MAKKKNYSPFNGIWPALSPRESPLGRPDSAVPALYKFSMMDPEAATKIADWCRIECLVDINGFVLPEKLLDGYKVRLTAYLCKTPYDLQQYVKRVEWLLGLSAPEDVDGPYIPHPQLNIVNNCYDEPL